MQSDDRLAELAEKLRDERDELPGVEPLAVPSVKLEATGEHISQIGTQVNINHNVPAPDLLSPEQRRRLNRLVTQISSEYETDPRLLWKDVVHTRTGVSSIEEITKDRFADAEHALLDHAELLRQQAHAKRLVAEVLEVANRRGVYQEMTRYCSREFGATVLNKLNPEQLKAVLRYVEADAAPQAASKADKLPFMKRMISLSSQHPAHLATVLAVGIVIGKIF